MTTLTREVVTLNRCRCRLCGDVITSNRQHAYISCKCGEIYTDGGNAYIRRGANDLYNIIDMSVVHTEEYQSNW
jgi:hypothetical protein